MIIMLTITDEPSQGYFQLSLRQDGSSTTKLGGTAAVGAAPWSSSTVSNVIAYDLRPLASPGLATTVPLMKRVPRGYMASTLAPRWKTFLGVSAPGAGRDVGRGTTYFDVIVCNLADEGAGAE